MAIQPGHVLKNQHLVLTDYLLPVEVAPEVKLVH